MIIPVIIIFAGVGLTLTLALYSGFMPYFSLISDIKNYNQAYYGAYTAVERSLLVLKRQDLWFEGSWWWTGVNSYFWPNSDALNDSAPFGYYNNYTTMFWDIRSRTTTWNIVPWLEGDMLDPDLQEQGEWYGVLYYGDTLLVPLRRDATLSQDVYKPWLFKKWQYTGPLQIRFVLNDTIKNFFWTTAHQQNYSELCETCTNASTGEHSMVNSKIIDWKLTGNPSVTGNTFTIYPSGSWSEDGMGGYIVAPEDEYIRPSDINRMTNNTDLALVFGDNINPLYDENVFPDQPLRLGQNEEHEVDWDAIMSGTTTHVSTGTFQEIFEHTINNELEFALTRELKTDASDWWLYNDPNVYPFIQYQIIFDNNYGVIPYPYFTFLWESRVGKYTVSIAWRKYLSNKFLWSFSVIF